MGAYLPYNQVYGIATHNSYWINRSDQADIGASGTQELITDQLLHDHVRAIEIDVHSEGAAPGQWKVYHTSDSEDFLGRYLEDYLEYLRNFQYAVPQHDLINVIVELKNVVPSNDNYLNPSPVNHNFSSDHTIDQFDDIFRRYLEPWLYTPGDFFAISYNATTLAECARTDGWPTIDELRGKFIVNILGNWSTAAYDWVLYATSDLRNRVAFPMQSVFEAASAVAGIPPSKYFQVTADDQTFWIRDIDDTFPCPDIDLAARRAAFEASVFWQLEDLSSFALDRAKDFLKRGGVIRGHDAFQPSEQLGALTAGFQMVQTDYPWAVVNDEAPQGLGIPTDPSRRLRDGSWLQGPPDTSPGPFREPGARFYAHTSPPAEIWAYATVPAVSQRWWEATVSTTRYGDTWTTVTRWAGIPHSSIPYLDDVLLSFPRRAQENGRGIIRVQSQDGQDTVAIVRHKETQPGASYYQEKVMVSVIVNKGGQEIDHFDLSAARYGPCRRGEDPNSDDVTWTCIGSLIALSIDNRDNGSTVTAFSAGKTRADGTPDWQQLGQWNFEQPLTQQGFSGYADVLFAGPRVANALDSYGLPVEQLDFVKLEDLPGRQIFNSDSSGDARFVDLSGAIGGEPGPRNPSVQINGPTDLTAPFKPPHSTLGHYSIMTSGMQDPLTITWHTTGSVANQGQPATTITFTPSHQEWLAGNSFTRPIAVHVADQSGLTADATMSVTITPSTEPPDPGDGDPHHGPPHKPPGLVE